MPIPSSRFARSRSSARPSLATTSARAPRESRWGLAAVAAASLAALGCAPDDSLIGNAAASGAGPGAGGAPSTSSGDGGADSPVGPGGGAAGCASPAECPDPDGACLVAACDAGVCGSAPEVQGTEIIDQVVGDCRVVVCDAAGATTDVSDPNDLVDDGNDCTIEACVDGALEVGFTGAGTACGPGGDLACDAAGQCTGCVTADQCPGEDGACRTRVCAPNGVCGFDDAAAGTVVEDSTGDCLVTVCDGNGNEDPTSDPDDLPSDSNPCTEDLCADGEPDFPPTDPGSPCGGGVCDGDGNCAGCADDGDCGADTPCADVFCQDDGSCGSIDAGPGTPFDPVPGDCVHSECDGNGGSGEVFDDIGIDCDGGGVCDGDGVCRECILDEHCDSNLCDGGTCRDCEADDECTTDLCRCGICVKEVTLFFSEYVEGSASNKAVEIYNPTGADIDLGNAGCSVRVYANGGNASVSIPLDGTLGDGEVLVICNSATTFPLLCDETSFNANWSGNDAVALICNGVILDVIGRIGEDPGTQWGMGSVTTAGATLRRKTGIVAGDGNGTDAFDPAAEWDGFANNATDGLGSHDPCP